MITDVHSLTDRSADELRWAEGPRDRWPCVCADGVGPKELARLAEVLGVGPYEEILAGFSFLAGERQESPWVVRFPEELATALAALSPEAAGQASAAWAQLLVPMGVDAAGVLTGLVDLASEPGELLLYITVDATSGTGAGHEPERGGRGASGSQG